MIDEIVDFLQERISQFGGKEKENYIFRKYTKDDGFEKGGAYFGIISPHEAVSGQYHDLCIVIFPSKEENSNWILSLGVGSLGFKNDQQLALMPGLRRLFKKLVDENSFVKTDFADVETPIDMSFINREDLSAVKGSLELYKKYLPVCQVLDIADLEDCKKKISAFLAAYSKIRNWKVTKAQAKAITSTLVIDNAQIEDEENTIANLLITRKYLVLQGAAGTGKTRMARKIAKHINAKVFFTQFHAEVSYSDFIYGLRPNINADKLVYTENIGVLPKAIEYAKNHKENVLLIIDEINRANLSNVLGEVFYLFEYKQDSSDVSVNVTPNLNLTKLPENLYVIATMNTSDRSLAVVDFALRRRFSWYTMVPHILDISDFHANDFSEFETIFNWYATTDELSLQPGHAYFIASTKEEMDDRIKYELMPLIKEYLREGYLQNAKEAFNSYFVNRIQKTLFE